MHVPERPISVITPKNIDYVRFRRSTNRAKTHSRSITIFLSPYIVDLLQDAWTLIRSAFISVIGNLTPFWRFLKLFGYRTIHKMWFHHCDLDRKEQSKEWKPLFIGFYWHNSCGEIKLIFLGCPNSSQLYGSSKF